MRKLLLFFFFGLFSLQANAQDPQLFDNTWYIQKVVVDGIEYERPYETFEGNLYLSLDEINVWHQQCDEGFGSLIQYDTVDNIFTFDDGGVAILGICVDPDILIFMEKHYSVYFIDDNFARNPFTYVLETINDHTSLTIINADGDQAIYGDVLLSIDDFSYQAISIYPNPVKDIITIENASNVEVESVKIYDVMGRLVLDEKDNFSQIDVSHLNSSVLFVEIETEEGIISKKLIKE